MTGEAMIDVTLLGTGGTMPLKDRWLSSCLVSVNGSSILIDCGEGTQIALKMTKNKFKPIDIICFTHFHADHISGLAGFLLSMGNEGRNEPVTLIGPRGLGYVVKCLCVIANGLPFELNFIEIDSLNNACAPIKLNSLKIIPFYTDHTVECLGYSVELGRIGKFDAEKARQNNVPLEIWAKLQKNPSVEYKDKLYTSDMVLGEQRKGIKLTYCTDTRPTDSIVLNAQKSDLFICEGMFGDDNKLKRAEKTKHMLFSEAARLARLSCVKRLWRTHYSPSLDNPREYLNTAREIFENTECGFDGKTISLDFPDE